MLTEPKTPDIPEWLRELYPFRTRTAIVNGCRMSSVDEGPADAPPVLMLHGNPTWSFMYRHLIRSVMPTRRVIAPDQIGFGLSEKPRDPAYHTLDRHIQNLAKLVDELGLKNITLVAQGWGGPIGLGYAVRHSQNISRLILCSTWPLPVANVDQLKLPFRIRLASAGRIGRYFDSVLNLSLTAAITSRAYQMPSDWTIEGYKFPFPTTTSRVAIAEFTRMFLKPSAHDRATMEQNYRGLKMVTAPTDIIIGAHDPLLTHLPAYLLRDALPNAREPIVVPKASHLLLEDAPDAVAEAILREAPSKSENKPSSLFNILK